MTTITTVTAKIFLAWRTDFPVLIINHSLFAVSPHLLIAQYRFYYFYPIRTIFLILKATKLSPVYE